ncbi:MAG TPA: hypothetical protein VJ011_07010, partial [Steroidobacteraceae bacterium]|nr:hypothetical protein [Steroidobacteraceae bacterium]
LERLTHGGRLPAAASLTVREIEARALLPDADDRARLAALAAAAERARFAAAPAEGTALDGALAAGTELLGRLETKGARIS